MIEIYGYLIFFNDFQILMPFRVKKGRELVFFYKKKKIYNLVMYLKFLFST